MLLLFAASFLWAFSFGLIKRFLAAADPVFVAWARMLIASLVFLPFLRLQLVKGLERLELAGIGAVQYGLMYVFYIASFRYLAAHQVALFTIFTPIYVTLLCDLMRRRFHARFLLTALLAVAGAAVIVTGRSDVVGAVLAFILVQLSNICFAIGQVAYPAVMSEAALSNDRGTRLPVTDRGVFGLLYGGGLVLTSAALVIGGRWPGKMPDMPEMLTLLYLGLLPSGLGFFLWNVGARRVNAGVLAVFNNVKIPLAMLCSFFFFGETGDWTRLTIGGGAIFAALVLNQAWARKYSRVRQSESQ